MTLNSYYKNKVLSDAFMQYAVGTLEVYNLLNQAYGSSFEIFTKQEIAYFDDFPVTRPDIYLRGDAEHFVTLAHEIQPFLIRKRLNERIYRFRRDQGNLVSE
jgi:hypothetical protein